jgi:hypothetical protein
MRFFTIILLCCLFFTVSEAGSPGKIFPTLKHDKAKATTGTGNITFVKFSNSVNGPFTTPATLHNGDSLFVQLDVSPLGSVYLVFNLDLNQNGILDASDLSIGDANLIDNGGTGKDVDLDPNAGVIVIYLETGETPQMDVVAVGTEGATSAVGILHFQNTPLTYTLSGHVYTSVGNPIGGAMVFVQDSMMNMLGAVSDLTGYYSVPIEAGTYGVHIQDWASRYSSFDTMMTFTGNTVHDFTLKVLSSYIRGYVRDELANPLPNVLVWAGRNSSVATDSSGMYKVMVSPGSENVGVEWQSVYPNYMQPNSHYYSIADNDSIINNSISNFTCYTTNATITGKVTENGGAATRQYMVNGWCSPLESSTYALTDVNGDYALHIHSSVAMEQYGANLIDWGGDYAFPPGMYPDTNYWGLTAGAVANFDLIGALTTYEDHFTGNGGYIGSMWNIYNYRNPWGINSMVTLENDRLKVECNSNDVLSGLGVISMKPFTLSNREFRIYADPSSMMSSNNTIKIVLTDVAMNWQHPQNFENSLQLIWEKNALGYRQWRLVKSQNGSFNDLCTSSDSTGRHILFQFIDPDTLKLTIGGVVYFNGQWGNMITMAYVYLTQFNLDPEESNPVYFDEFVWDAIGTVGVKEIGGVMPKAFALDQNYPNPFNPATSIKYHLPVSSYVTLKVFNQLGQEVKSLVSQQQAMGNYEVSFDATQQPSGIYYYQLTAVDETTGKLLTKSSMKALLLK